MDEKTARFARVRFFLLLALIASGLAMLIFSPLSEVLSPSKFSESIQKAGPLAPVILILIFILRPIVLFPASILVMASGLAFGTWMGELYSIIGSTMGAILAFYLAKFLGKDFVDSVVKKSKRLERIEEKIEKNGFRIIVLLRLIPIMPFDAINYTAGLTRIKTFDYAAGTIIGLIPATLVYAYLGSSMLDIWSLKFLISALLFVLLILVSILVFRKYK